MKRAVVAALLTVLAVSACHGGDGTPTDAATTKTATATPTPTPTPTTVATTKAASKPKTLSTEGRHCRFLEEPLRLFPGHDLSTATRGLHMKEVQELQSMINGAGDGSSCIPEDGDFGPVTRDAVKAFQTTYDLTVDGLVGEPTWNQLNLLLSH